MTVSNIKREQRIAEVKRKTRETDIIMKLCLDGDGTADIETGIGFFDHMLNSFARHGFFNLTVKARGDLSCDCHHTIEDTGLVLGDAIKEALKTKDGIRRFGDSTLPMDDALVLCAVDLSGRPYLSFDCDFKAERVGYLDTEMVKEFFYAVACQAGMNIHIKKLSGENTHHVIEAIFKAFARALSDAVSYDDRLKGEALSTKGSI